MSYIADLHIHSYLSRATSGECNLTGLQRWAQLKGVSVVGTGDFTHPEWFAELQASLVPSKPGLYRLRPELAVAAGAEVHASCRAEVEFMLTGEISSIYKRDGRVRKVHNLLLLPDLESAARLNTRLGALGNIKSDGRPILGLDPRDLLELLIECSPQAYMIPAHIWTPWFAMLGSKSGFDSIAECFGELSPHIFAVETGLSSDPPMNWRVSHLDRVTLVSNSDLHSPANMARNANLFYGEPDFHRIRDGLKRQDPAICGGTIDMFPEEGKYHLDGHRNCGVSMEPEESLALDCLCPKCGKELVLGVLHRVAELADRPKGAKPATALPCQYIIPLPELLGELFDCGAATRKVDQAYHKLLREFGPELKVLRETDPQELDRNGPALFGEAVRRVRAETVIRQGGYDGEYGVIRVFGPGEKDRLRRQAVFLSMPVVGPAPKPAVTPVAAELRESSDPEYRLAAVERQAAVAPNQPPGPLGRDAGSGEATATPAQPWLFAPAPASGDALLADLDPDQRAAASDTTAPVLIVAGPGTGKTRTLTHRIAHLVQHCGVAPEQVLAVTFTNRAAGEMRERLERLLPAAVCARLTVATFHAFCLDLLRRHHELAGLAPEFAVLDQDDVVAALVETAGMGRRAAAALVDAIGQARRTEQDPAAMPGFAEFARALTARQALDLDGIVPAAVDLLRHHPEVLTGLALRQLCVDEYQDINRAQYELIRLLAPQGRGLCAIGDPDQAIYGFRGSDVAFFLRFQLDFPEARVYSLRRNFRSDAGIVRAASQVIAPGRSAMSAAAESVFSAGVRLRFHSAASAAAEAEFIAHETEKWLGGVALFSVDSERVSRDGETGVSLGDIAVLVRLRSLAPPIADALTRLGLPVQVVGDRGLAQEPEVRKLVDGLRRQPQGVLCASAADAVREAVDGLTAGGRGPAAPLSPALRECRDRAAAFDGTLLAFLDHLALRQPADAYDARAEKVLIMTLHAAKGLEFPVVFVAGCEDGTLPWLPPDRAADVEEERRLLYVGMTRAQRILYLTHARKRTLFGKTEDRQPSRFLDEIEAALRQELALPQRQPPPREQQLQFDFGP